MPETLTCLTVFIASPSGLGEERKALRKEISEFNEAVAMRCGKYFRAVGCEDVLGGIGRPQSIINEELKKADFCVVLL